MEHSFVKAEAVKVSYRQTKDGMVVAFAIHPNDMPPELALAPVGTRVLLAVAELSDEPPRGSAEQPAATKDAAREDAGRPPSISKTKSERGKEAYAMKDEMEKAVTRAALLCKERVFQDWIIQRWFRDGGGVDSKFTHESAGDRERHTTTALKDMIGADSRSQIATHIAIFEKFKALELEFAQHSGRFAQVRG